MHIDKFIEIVKNLELPIGKYVLFGSAALAIRGLREADDIDILMSEDLWYELKVKSGWKLGISKLGSEYLSCDNIGLYKDLVLGDQDISFLISSADIISDLPFLNLDELIKWKQILKREKDLKDIELINNFLK